MNSLWEILVPTVTPKGKPIHTRFHRVWDAKVREIAGGLTIYFPSKGQWISPTGKLFVERMIPVRIACTEEQINIIADLTAKYYKQQAIFFYEVSQKVFTKRYDPEQFTPVKLENKRPEPL